MEGLDICKYSPDRGVDHYASGLAAILKVVVGPGKPSTHAYVSEIRRAMHTLVFSIWDRSDEYVLVVAEANIPTGIRSPKMKECFKELLVGLLKRFKETTDDLPIGARIRLMNMTIAGIAEMARRGVSAPVGEEIYKFIFSNSGSSPESQSEEGGEKA
ncbi:MAG: hypothetical protein F7C38_07490 [Desulfurococcales archaeon]|nr:hypothetical protein [Desulfurococcales archaeon]